MRPIVHSEKHYVQMSLSPVTTGTRVNNVLVVTAVTPTALDAIHEGALVKAVYIELWVQGESGQQASIVVLEKAQSGATGVAFANMTALGSYINKKNVLFTHQGITSNDGVSAPTNIMRGWYKIPKGKQRFGLGDSLVLSIANQTAGSDIIFCGFAVYKEYS